MKTLFIGIADHHKTLCRNSALKAFYIDSANDSICITEYINQPEGYFMAETETAEIRYFQSPGQNEPYKIEYFFPMQSGAVVMKVNHEKWVLDIWHKLNNPDQLREQTINLNFATNGK